MDIRNFGATKTTFENYLVDSGYVAKNVKLDMETGAIIAGERISATTGGIQINVTTERRIPEVDNVYVPTKGNNRIVKQTAQVIFTCKEATPTVVQLALNGELDTTTSKAFDIVRTKNDISTDDYLENICFIGFLSGEGYDGEPCIIMLKNALATGNLSTQTAKDTEAGFQITMDCYSDTIGDRKVPIEFLFPRNRATVAGVVSEGEMSLDKGFVKIEKDGTIIEEVEILAGGTYSLTISNVEEGVDYRITAGTDQDYSTNTSQNIKLVKGSNTCNLSI